MTEQMKRCYRCGELKPLSEFYNDRSRKDGKKNLCKICDKEKNKKYHEANREKVYVRVRQWYKIHKNDKSFKKNESSRVKKYNSCVKNPSCPAVGGQGAEFIIFTCEVCGAEFRQRKSYVDWLYEHTGCLPKFCSRECYYTSRRKGYTSPYAKRITELQKVHR